MSDVQVPQFAAPFQFNTDGTVAVNEQDSPADIAASVYNLLCCPVGASIADPDIGIPSPLFQTLPVDTTAILAAVQQQEPRATYEIVQQVTTQMTESGVTQIAIIANMPAT